MLTRCPTCRTTFRVTAEQLKARQGRVRCGHCQGVFNALETLVEAEAPVAAPVPETVVAPAVEVPAVSIAPATPPAREVHLTAAGTVGEPGPIEPVVAATPPLEAEGEEVAEPDVEYVEIAALEPGEDDDLTDVLTSPEADFEDGFVAAGADDGTGAAGNAADKSPDDHFTKTVVGFTWYVEPEPPEAASTAQTPAEDYTRTVVQAIRAHEPEPAPEPVPRPEGDEFTRTVIAPWRIAAPEPAPQGTPAPAGSIARPAIDRVSVAEPEAEPALARTDPADFAKTVVQSIRMFEPEIAPEPAKARAAEFDETATLPLAVDDEITTLVGDEPPTNQFAFPSIEPLAIDLPAAAPKSAGTPAGTERFDTVGEPGSNGETESTPAKSADADDFAKTVVQSIRMFEPEPEPEPAEKPAADEFESTVVEPRRVDRLETTTAIDGDLHGHAFAFPTVEPVAGDEAEDEPAPAGESGEREFTRTVFDVERVAPPPDDEALELDFDLAPIDDIHVEEVEEKPSIVDLSIATPTSFPTLEPLSESDEQPSHETANAILQQLAASAAPHGAATAHDDVPELPEPIAEPEKTAKAPLELEEFLANAFAGGPAAQADAETAAAVAPAADAIPELQELPARRRWPWVLGGIVAACLLAAQAIVHYRVELSVKIPGSKPALQAMCELLDCKLPLPSQIDLIGIETSDLSPGSEGAGHLQLAAALRNRAPYSQAWPHLELTLTDAADKALVRRTLGPADYLPPTRKPEDGFPARSEQPVHLELKAPGVPAVGYRLYVFYP